MFLVDAVFPEEDRAVDVQDHDPGDDVAGGQFPRASRRLFPRGETSEESASADALQHPAAPAVGADDIGRAPLQDARLSLTGHGVVRGARGATPLDLRRIRRQARYRIRVPLLSERVISAGLNNRGK